MPYSIALHNNSAYDSRETLEQKAIAHYSFWLSDISSIKGRVTAHIKSYAKSEETPSSLCLATINVSLLRTKQSRQLAERYVHNLYPRPRADSSSQGSATRRTLCDTVKACNSLAMSALGRGEMSRCKGLLTRALEMTSGAADDQNDVALGRGGNAAVGIPSLQVLTLNNMACLHRR